MRRQTLIGLTVALLPTLALAEPQLQAPPPESTNHRHLGFFLRLELGGGYLHSRASPDVSVDGGGVLLGIAVGGAPAENWILAGELWDSTDATGARSTSGGDSTFSLIGFGVNLTHYFMPANVYLTVVPALSVLNFRTSNTTVETQAGFGLKVALGKEWWVGDHWGLGIAGQFLFGTNRDAAPSSTTWTTFGGGLTLSATYN